MTGEDFRNQTLLGDQNNWCCNSCRSPTEVTEPAAAESRTEHRRVSERYLWLIVPVLFLGYWAVEWRGRMNRRELLDACRTEVLAELNHPTTAKFEWDEMVRIAPADNGRRLRSTVEVPDQSGAMVRVKFVCDELEGKRVRLTLEKR